MAIPNIPTDQLRKALSSLEQASYNHDQWAEAIHGTLVCRLAPDKRDLAGDADHRCRFGQWYYEVARDFLGQHPGFEAIGIEHARMHQFATTLLRSAVSDEKVEIEHYEHFVTARKRLILETTALQRELGEALNNLDPLTGTTSRVGMLIMLREQQELVKRGAHSCIVAMMDLDHFKKTNEKYGHIVGDKVLIDVSHCMMTQLRPYDRVFRYGGEEFMIFLPNTDLQAGHTIISKVREAIGSLPHEANGNVISHVTASFGLTLLAPDIPVEQSVDRADKALFVAKEGRNRVVTWDSSMEVLWTGHSPPVGVEGQRLR